MSCGVCDAVGRSDEHILSPIYVYSLLQIDVKKGALTSNYAVG